MNDSDKVAHRWGYDHEGSCYQIKFYEHAPDGEYSISCYVGDQLIHNSVFKKTPDNCVALIQMAIKPGDCVKTNIFRDGVKVDGCWSRTQHYKCPHCGKKLE